MTTVFIAGSISISRLHEKVQERINNIISSDLNVVVGDADGADTSIQQCLRDYHATKVTVYCTGDNPRNNVADWPVHRVRSKARAGSRAFFTAKDLEMARSSDYGLMVWDCKSTGTLSNVIELLKEKKKSVVFVNKNKEFVTIADKVSLENLLHFMSEHARAKAEEKIGLLGKLAELNQEQFSLDISCDGQPSAAQADQGDSAAETITEDAEQTESMKLRFELMAELKEYIYREHLNQSQAAKVFGVTQPRISDLTRGKVDLFGLDALVNMASTAGLRVEMRVRPI
ncbi:XRE family transcriptional regulator [Xanthomonas campestris pv. phormiicola]|nr:XRE family transcriptional regulator [Xanthomonas campestris pv. phormiicola]UYC16456.1 XRE family transcriptional regulator [Xanthomonas campestris pv. phormiicola]